MDENRCHHITERAERGLGSGLQQWHQLLILNKERILCVSYGAWDENRTRTATRTEGF